MKCAGILACLLLTGGAMYADLIPTLTSISPITSGADAGDFNWTYSVAIGPGSEVVPALGLGGTQPWPNFFSIIDFGSPTVFPIGTPAGWGGSADTIAPNAENTNAPNQASISDIVINYTGSTNLTGPVVIPGFSFVSTTDQEALGWYEGQGTKFDPGAIDNGTEQGNVGQVVVPYFSSGNLQQVPEPTTFGLVAIAFVGLTMLRLRQRAA